MGRAPRRASKMLGFRGYYEDPGDDVAPENYFDHTATLETIMGFLALGCALAQVNVDSTARFVGAPGLGTAAFAAVTAALPLGGAVGALAVAGPAHNHGRRSAKLAFLGVGAGGALLTVLDDAAACLGPGRLLLGAGLGGWSAAARGLLYEEAGHEGELGLAAFLPPVALAAGCAAQCAVSWACEANARLGWRPAHALVLAPLVSQLWLMARDNMHHGRRRKGRPCTVAGARFGDHPLPANSSAREAGGDDDDESDGSDGDAALLRDAAGLLRADDALLRFEDHAGFPMRPAPRSRAARAKRLAKRAALCQGLLLGPVVFYGTLILHVGGYRTAPAAALACLCCGVVGAAVALLLLRLRPRRALARVAVAAVGAGALVAGLCFLELGDLAVWPSARRKSAALVGLAAGVALFACGAFGALALPDAILVDAFLAHAHHRALSNRVGLDFRIFGGLSHSLAVCRLDAHRYLGLFLAAGLFPFAVEACGNDGLFALLDDDGDSSQQEAKRGAGVVFLLYAAGCAAAYAAVRWRLRTVGGVVIWRDRPATQDAVVLTDDDYSIFEAVFQAVSGRPFDAAYGDLAGGGDDDDDASENLSASDA